ncbi:MAG: DoxX family protein [Pirellulaceae bacterium]
MFHSMVWDRDGFARLNLDETKAIWERAPEQAARHFGFDESQRKSADQLYKRYEASLRTFHADNSSEIREYYGEMERLDRDNSEPARIEVASLRGQVAKRESEQKGKLRGWLTKLEEMGANYETDLNALATDRQASRGEFHLGKPGRRFMDSEWIDGAVRYFDLTIGLLLIVGLFTRFVAVAGAVFLGSIVLTQPPWVADAAPTYYQVNLMLALLVLAAVGAGRFAGLDFLLGALRHRCCPPKQETK